MMCGCPGAYRYSETVPSVWPSLLAALIPDSHSSCAVLLGMRCYALGPFIHTIETRIRDFIYRQDLKR